MVWRTRSGLLLASITLCLLTLPSTLGAAETRPNLVIVLADDLGYGDVACYGNQVARTPNLDAFAKQSVRFTACYSAAPNCSPARTGLMTGRTPYRVGVHNWIPFNSPVHVRKDEITIATLLRNAGYDTCHVGKWHLNGRFNQEGQPQPGDHGFNHWFSTQNNALPNHKNPVNFVRNGKPVGELTGYSAGLVADEAIDWLENKRDKAKPIFLYICLHEPHEPIASAPEYTKEFPSDDPSYSAYFGNLMQMDAAFGRIAKALEKNGLRDNTLLIFTSDNGPAITSIHPHGSPGPLRSKKGSLYEGGIRVPGIIRWPGHTKAGDVCETPVSAVDFLPTICEIAGVKPPTDRPLDGMSLVSLLNGKTMSRDKPLYWQFNFSLDAPKVAMRKGDWKILATLNDPPVRSNDLTAENSRRTKEAELKGFELYNLKNDLSETTDLADTEPEQLATMKKLLAETYYEVRKESPTWPAWTFERHEGQRIIWPPYRKTRRRK